MSFDKKLLQDSGISFILDVNNNNVCIFIFYLIIQKTNIINFLLLNWLQTDNIIDDAIDGCNKSQ